MTINFGTRAMRPLIVRRVMLAAGAALFAALGACSSDGPTAVFDPDAPARLQLDASVRFQSPVVGSATLRVSTSYVRSNQSLVPLDSQWVSLTDAPSQQVPITIDLATCLRDAQRAGLGRAEPAPDQCVVVLELALITNGQIVDRETIRDVSMRSGQTSNVDTPITLEEVGTLRLNLPAANVVTAGAPLRLEATRTLTIGAEVIDGANRPITRTIAWSSANAAVATVTGAGVVTGVAPGTTRITATVAGISQFTDVRVVPLPQTVTVTAASGSTGTGTVVSSPAGINCTVTGTTTSGTCSSAFPGDATVSLAMTTGTNTTFSGWGGDCTGTAACSFATSQPRAVSVNLRSFRTLTVAATGTGNGTISAPGGVINCVWRFGSSSSGPCTAQIPDGAQVTLTATAESGSQFVGWNSECTTVTGNSCEVTMNANRSVVAQFRALSTYRITAGLGTGSGTVVSSPAGMTCTVTGTSVSGSCSLTVPAGTNVSFTATGTSGSSWRVWDGICANATATCSTTAPQLPSEFGVRVGFERIVMLRVSAELRSTGTGRVTGTGAISCQVNGTAVTGTCEQSYPVGTVVTLQAARTGYTDLAAWGGACANAGSNNSCTLTLNADQAATVRFAELPTATFTVWASASEQDFYLRVRHPYQAEQECLVRASFSEESTECRFTVPRRSDFTLTAQIPTNYLLYYQGYCESSTTTPCVLQVDGDASMYAYGYPDYYSEGSREAGLRRARSARPIKPPSN